ncbi:HPP family protein [Dyella sp. GSA-30]|uniref:HPP family protein n=1 Tax=Dyella sp. GSA-30 TaxID=2994496 RepID=UPI00249246DF|nr:HPP family protein [Dyella sp. GSA-30]
MSVPKFNFAIRGLIGGTAAIVVLGLAGQGLHQTVLIAPFGASCVLLFAAPESPFAQPRNLVFGHLLTASVGLAMLWLAGSSIWSVGLAVGLVVALMELTRTVHPPAGANPIVIMLGGKASLLFLFTPVLCGVGLLLALALVVNNVGGKRWPLRWS